MTVSAIRAAAIGDLAGLVELMAEFYAESDLALPPGPAAAALERLLRDDRLGRAWLLEVEGRVAGYVVLTLGYSMEYGGPRGLVDDFYIRPEFRGLGVGTSALAEVRRTCLDLGVRALVAEVGGSDEAAKAAYRKSGLADTGNVLMALPLASPVHVVFPDTLGSGGTVDWPEVRRELLAMAEHDLAVRGELAADGSLFHGYHHRMQGVHDTNAARLAAIIAERGWPGEPQVGREGANAAWLIAQHAIAQPGLQRAALTILWEAAERGDVPALQAAMLEDRVRAFEGRPQRYGTQFDWDVNGELSPLPIEDPEGIDDRRRTLGLAPLEEDLAERRRAIAEGQERPPSDGPARQREMEAWLRAVGWRR